MMFNALKAKFRQILRSLHLCKLHLKYGHNPAQNTVNLYNKHQHLCSTHLGIFKVEFYIVFKFKNILINLPSTRKSHSK